MFLISTQRLEYSKSRFFKSQIINDKQDLQFYVDNILGFFLTTFKQVASNHCIRAQILYFSPQFSYFSPSNLTISGRLFVKIFAKI